MIDNVELTKEEIECIEEMSRKIKEQKAKEKELLKGGWKPKISCIYSIVNKQNGKRYIGETERLDNRIYQHVSNLQNGLHPSKKLQKDYEKYGFDVFKVEILEEVENDLYERLEREKYYIRKFISECDLYNNKIPQMNNNTPGEL